MFMFFDTFFWDIFNRIYDLGDPPLESFKEVNPLD